MKNLVELIRSALPGALGTLIAAALVGLLGWLWRRWLRPWLRKEECPSVKPTDEGRGKERHIFFIACLTVLIIAMYMWNEMIGPLLSGYLVDTDIDTLIHGHCWVTYDPLHFDPFLFPNPEVDWMSKELEWIRNAGFDGIITFTSRGTFSMIPELAKEESLFVIMGVWDPTDRQEVAAAVSKREHVDAYCVGHNGLGWLYSYGDLVEAIRYIRFRTRRPVSTTEQLRRYLDDKRLLKVGDWVFPDSHVSIKDDSNTSSAGFLANAVRDGKLTIDAAISIAEQEGRDGKPILLKIVTCPMGGIPNASLQEQAEFFVTVLEPMRDPLSNWPSDVSISVHSAFDMPWKTTWPFYEWDPYTGLLDDDGTPRPAVQEIERRLP